MNKLFVIIIIFFAIICFEGWRLKTYDYEFSNENITAQKREYDKRYELKNYPRFKGKIFLNPNCFTHYFIWDGKKMIAVPCNYLFEPNSY